MRPSNAMESMGMDFETESQGNFDLDLVDPNQLLKNRRESA